MWSHMTPIQDANRVDVNLKEEAVVGFRSKKEDDIRTFSFNPIRCLLGGQKCVNWVALS